MYQPNIYGNGTDLNCEQAYVGGWSRGPRKSSAEIIRVNAAPDTGYCTESFFGAHSWQRRNGTGSSRTNELCKTLACLESLFGGRILGIINIQREKMGPISNNRFKTDRAPVLYCFCLDFWLVSCTREKPSGLLLYFGNVSGPTTFDRQNEVVWGQNPWQHKYSKRKNGTHQ